MSATATATTQAFPQARRQTYTFLNDARSTCHVFLMTSVDATAIEKARASATGRLSVVSLVVKATAAALADHPDARLVLSDGWRPRLHAVPGIHAKVLFDKLVDDQRCVVSGAITDVDDRSLEEVQDAVDTYKAADVDGRGPFKQVTILQRLPLPLGRLLYRLALRNPARRAEVNGTFSVTSVGQEPVQTILPMITGTLGFGVGRIEDAPVVHEGRVEVRPVLPLSMAFDHRVLDGAAAAAVLGQVKANLEGWSA
jgi:pyruvate/2-oxoglutarate dehydrogenase complex dihydrolipoamide acyltransferase (E2) component